MKLFISLAWIYNMVSLVVILFTVPGQTGCGKYAGLWAIIINFLSVVIQLLLMISFTIFTALKKEKIFQTKPRYLDYLFIQSAFWGNVFILWLAYVLT